MITLDRSLMREAYYLAQGHRPGQKRPKGMRDGYVYALAHPAMPARLKIGRTDDLHSRLSSFQIGCPDMAYGFAATAKVFNYKAVESALHRLFGDAHHSGEWFRLLGEEVVLLFAALGPAEAEGWRHRSGRRPPNPNNTYAPTPVEAYL